MGLSWLALQRLISAQAFVAVTSGPKEITSTMNNAMEYISQVKALSYRHMEGGTVLLKDCVFSHD